MKHFFCSNTFKSFGILIALGFMLGSCKHKTNFDSMPEVSYSGNIAPIINSNCAYSGCHGDSSYVKFKATTYLGLIDGGISSGNPQKSKVYTSLKTLGDDIMPKKPYSELTEKQIQLIYVWIGQGAKNN